MTNEYLVKNYFNKRIKLISPNVFKDNRGYFYELYNNKKLKNIIGSINFVQDNFSFSKDKYTIRGMHFQRPPYNQAKLITVIEGEIIDAVIDINPKSEFYGKSKIFKLSSENKKILFINSDFAHGFCSLEKNTKIMYKVSNYYNPKFEKTILWSDKYVNIKWPVSKKYTISEKDQLGSSFNILKKQFKLFK